VFRELLGFVVTLGGVMRAIEIVIRVLHTPRRPARTSSWVVVTAVAVSTTLASLFRMAHSQPTPSPSLSRCGP
jgi:hypothetical protein